MMMTSVAMERRFFTFYLTFLLESFCIIDNKTFLVCDQAGCAFLKYETKDQALAALEALNGKHRMEVCFLAVIVKYFKHHFILLYFFLLKNSRSHAA
jgi:RNA recognition motif. (a.k.a. RRM, RBD, or RNP domain)